MKAYQEFSDYIAQISNILNTMNLLNWDARTQMPVGGNATRSSPNYFRLESRLEKSLVRCNTLNLVCGTGYFCTRG
jgi:Zn-dependent M32 family carboxypeptidase